MKKTNTLYWIFTGLFSASMLFTAIPDIMNLPDAIKIMHDQLQYPLYFIPFIGWAKALGCVAILIPGFPRIKEWAYAGLAFDLFGAIYSSIAVAGFAPEMAFMLVWIGLGVASYYFFSKKFYKA